MSDILTTTKPGKKYASLKRPDIYEALRRQGHDKRAAARISNAMARRQRRKAYTLDDLEYAALKGDTEGAAAIAIRLPLVALKGEKLAPGVTRIRGDLCNVHGKWGSCSAAGFGEKPKQPRGSRRARTRKPSRSPGQRQQERAAERDANKKQTLSALGLDDAAQQRLADLRAGRSVADADTLVARGLAEQAADGSYRLTPTGRALVGAAESGDLGRARDTLSRAQDQQQARTQRAAERASRKLARELRRAEQQRKREEAAKKREAAGGGGGKKTETAAERAQQREREREIERATNRADVRAASDLGQAADALYTFADGGALAADQADGLVSTGLVERDALGGHRLSATGRAFVNAANRGDARAAQDALSRGRDRVAQAQQREQDSQQRTRDREERERERETERQRRTAERWQRRRRPGPIGPRSAPIQLPRGKTADPGDYLVEGMPLLSEKMARSPIQPSARLHGTATSLAGTGNTSLVISQRADAGVSAKDKNSISPSFTVFKDARGQSRWIARTTTAFEDRDGEILSVAALERDAARMDADGKYGPLRWWHVGKPTPLDTERPWGPGIDLGWTDFNAVHGRTLVESGTFVSEPVAQAVAARAADFELSPGFYHAASEPDSDGVFHHIHRFERSLVPRWAGKASNRYTGLFVQEHSMDAKRIEALKALGLPKATIDDLLANIEQTEKTADAADIRYKDAGFVDRLRQWLTGDEGQAMTTKESAPATIIPPPTAPDRLAVLEAQVADLTAALKAAAMPPPADAKAEEAVAIEVEAEAPTEEMDTPAEDAEFVGDMTPMEFSALLEEVFTRALRSAMGGISERMSALDEEMKALGYTRQKDDERSQQIAALKAQQDQQQAALDETRKALGELVADQPRVAAARPSQSLQNVIPDLAERVKETRPTGGPFDDIVAQLMGKA